MTLVACDGGPTGTESGAITPGAESSGALTITPTRIGLLVGDSTRITARYERFREPLDASSKLAWSSADQNVAKVDPSTGWIRAVGVGVTTIKVAVGADTATAPMWVMELAGTIAFTRTSFSDRGVSFDVLTYSNGTVHPVPREGISSIAVPGWSPDGARMAVELIRDVVWDPSHESFWYTSDVHLLTPDAPRGSTWQALTTDAQTRSPSWSPDGKHIAAVRGRMHSDANHIVLIDALTGVTTRVTETAGAYDAPRWSPDGTRLAFGNASSGISDVFVVNKDGSGLTNVTSSTSLSFEGMPSWSPDGRQLALSSTYVTNGVGYAHEIVVVDVGSWNPRRLTTRGWSGQPVWSPDGRFVAFAHFEENEQGTHEQGIYVIALDGSPPVRVTRPPAGSGDNDPVWKR